VTWKARWALHDGCTQGSVAIKHQPTGEAGLRSLFSTFKAKSARQEQPDLDTALWFSDRLPPRATPPFLEVDEYHAEFFKATLWMQPYLNMSCGDRWCFDEQDEKYCRLNSIDQPNIGRVYQVRFGEQKMGRLEVTNSNSWDKSAEFEFNISVELRHIEHLPYSEINSVLVAIALSVQDHEEIQSSRARAKSEANQAMVATLWDWMQSPSSPISRYTFSGPAGCFRATIDHWAKGGIDPWRDWAGDRPRRCA
jgi:hypothetical protein